MAKPIAFTGTAVRWFPVPHLIGSPDSPGPLLQLTQRELRFYLLILAAAGRDRELFVELNNADVRKQLSLDKDKGKGLAETREALVSHGLIRATRKKSSYLYEITNPEDGTSLVTGRRWFPRRNDEEDEGPTNSWGEPIPA